MAGPRKPKALKAGYLGVARIFEQLEECRKKLARANEIFDEPSDNLRYRDHLKELLCLEAQVDALGYVFQKSRPEMKKWVADMEAWLRKIETAA